VAHEMDPLCVDGLDMAICRDSVGRLFRFDPAGRGWTYVSDHRCCASASVRNTNGPRFHGAQSQQH
jgi:hypothetical protein